MTGNYTLSFREAAQVVESAGAKAASLGRLASAGFRVPAGFVLSAAAYQDFARAAGIGGAVRRFGEQRRDPCTEGALYDMACLRLACLRAPLPETLRSALISALAQSGIFGLPLAVRPSVACEEPCDAGFARLHRASLNVLGFDALEAAVRACWAGLWLPESVATRRRMGVRDAAVSMAVIIQRLVPADAAGVAFTREPETGGDAVVIRSAWGLGEGVTSGRADPDTFTLHPDAAGPILARADAGAKTEQARPAARGGIAWQSTLPEQHRRLSLSPAQAMALAETCRRIEQALDGPQVVEWARLGDDISLLQASPMAASRLPAAIAGAADLDEPAPPPWGAGDWSHLPLSQALPRSPTPFTWSLAHLLLDETLRRVLGGAGCPVPPGAQIARLVGGRPCLDLAALQWLFREAFAVEPDAVRRATGAEPVGAASPVGPAGLPARWRRMRFHLSGWRASRRSRSCLRQAARRLAGLERRGASPQADQGLLDAHLSNTEVALGYLPAAALTHARTLWAFLELEDLVRQRLGDDYLPGQVAGLLARGKGTALQVLSALARLAADPEARALLAEYALSPRETGADQPGAGVDSERPFSGTRAGEMLARFLNKHGHHALVDLEVMCPRWSEDPRHPLRMAASSTATARAAGSDAGERSRAAWAAIRRRLGPWDRFRCRRMVGIIRTGLGFQEMVGALLARQVALERRICLEVGARLVGAGVLQKPEDLFFLKAVELRALLLGETLESNVRALVSRRRREYEEHAAAASSGFAEATGIGGGPWQGVGVSGGKVVGRARVLRGAEDGWGVGSGEIVVAEWIGPAWATHLLRAGGLVLGGGGPLSQGAVIAREAGIPAVARLPGATARIPDGARLSLDGDRGLVELLD